MMKALKQKIKWCQASSEDVGYGLADQCPSCSGKRNYLLAGWWNPVTALGLTKWQCKTCRHIWIWSRHKVRQS
jgi:hypothetical protein